MRNIGSSVKRILAVSALMATSTAGLVAMGATPANASNPQAVPGTRQDINDTMYMRVNQGTYNGHWYAWAKVYNDGIGASGIALIWKYSQNGGLYQCGSRNGDDPYQLNGCSETPCAAYTAGVRKTQASLVQAKWAYDAPGGVGIVYGPAVDY